MVTNLILGVLPESVQVDGVNYPVRSDFRTWMEFDGIRNSSEREEKKLLQMLLLCYPTIPENLEAAIEKMIWFYQCGKPMEKEEKKERYQRSTSKGPAFSFSQDAPYIYSAFKEQYRIDLTEEKKLHWWKFMALFESLGEDTKMSKIMYYRKASTHGLTRERRAFINDMKKLYKIQEAPEKRLTLEERNRQWKEYVEYRHRQ